MYFKSDVFKKIVRGKVKWGVDVFVDVFFIIFKILVVNVGFDIQDVCMWGFFCYFIDLFVNMFFFSGCFL